MKDSVYRGHESSDDSRKNNHPLHSSILSNAEVIRKTATDFIASGDIATAKSLLEKGVSLFPNDPKLQNNLGQLYSVAGDLDAAHRALSIVVATDPSIIVAWLTLIRIARSKHDYIEVIRLIEDAAASGIPEDTLLPFRLATLNHFRMYSLAAITAENFLPTCELNEELTIEYLESLSHTHQVERGIHIASKFLRHNPHSVDIKLQYALLLQQAGRSKEGLSIIDSIDTSQPLHLLNMAQARVTMHEDVGEFSKAIKSASYCFENQHDVARNAHLLFSLHSGNGDWDSAWKYHAFRWLGIGRPDYADPTILPLWTAKDKDACVYVYSEQGIGDQILAYKILSLFTLVRPSHNLFLFEIDPKLNSLLPSTSMILVIPSRGRPLQSNANYTHHVSMYTLVQEILSTMSWPELFGNLDIHHAISESVLSYIYAPDQSRLAPSPQSWLGVCWRSNNPLVGKDQSLKLYELIDALKTARIKSALSLQYLPTSAEQEYQLSSQYDLKFPCTDLYSDIRSSAILVSSVVNVLSVSSYMAHLAGLIGVNTQLLISPGRAKAWYWNLVNSCNQSLVYPSLQVYQKADKMDSFTPLVLSALARLPG